MGVTASPNSCAHRCYCFPQSLCTQVSLLPDIPAHLHMGVTASHNPCAHRCHCFQQFLCTWVSLLPTIPVHIGVTASNNSCAHGCHCFPQSLCTQHIGVTATPNPARRCVLLHGGMKLSDKAAAVEAFRSGERPVMICTTVVEVGVDVSQASIIVVEHADRCVCLVVEWVRGVH